MARQPFAVFDIDGTLIRWQLYHIMVDKLAKRGALGESALDEVREARMAWKRREDIEGFKQYEHTLIEIYERALTHISTKHFDEVVLEVIEEYKDQTYVYTRELVKTLKAKGYLLLAISGSHHEMVEQIARYYGFDDCVGSHYERKGEVFTGEVFVASLDKQATLLQLVKKHGLDFKGSVAIGDSLSDLPMLAMVEQPIAFNPDRALLRAVSKHGWKVVVERKNVIYELEKRDGTYVLATPD